MQILRALHIYARAFLDAAERWEANPIVRRADGRRPLMWESRK
jgi:hypothetical protein